MDLGLEGKVVVVTAATANIGRGIALEFASERAKVVAVGRDEEAGRALVSAARDRGAEEAIFISADLRAPSAPALVVAEAEKLGPIEVLVNNLGGNVGRSCFVDSEATDWAEDIDLNFGTLLRMTHPVLKLMVPRKSGSIVNVGSTAGLVGDYMLPIYSAMKGAVHSFTTVLAKEVGQHNIRVNAIAPYATFATAPEAFSKGSRFHPQLGSWATAEALSAEEQALMQRTTLVGRPFASPEDLSGIVALLASQRASFVTGQIWPVDGGSLL